MDHYRMVQVHLNLCLKLTDHFYVWKYVRYFSMVIMILGVEILVSRPCQVGIFFKFSLTYNVLSRSLPCTVTSVVPALCDPIDQSTPGSLLCP